MVYGYLFDYKPQKRYFSVQLAKDIIVTQKSAWFMLHRLRHTNKTQTFQGFQGIVEADEVYIGGSGSNKIQKISLKVKKRLCLA